MKDLENSKKEKKQKKIVYQQKYINKKANIFNFRPNTTLTQQKFGQNEKKEL